jgi:hypothetical protein
VTVPAADKLRYDDGYSTPTLGDLWAAAELFDAIDALHQPKKGGWCRQCRTAWPCPTARLLHPEAGDA